MFVEDHAHEEVVGALISRIAEEREVQVRLDWRSAKRGYGRVVKEYRLYLQDLTDQVGPLHDLIVVAADSNCKGLNERLRPFQRPVTNPRVIFAIPEPHIERWLLLDGAAFRNVLGRGCDAPDQKCIRGRYKELLRDAVRRTGVIPVLGGVEFAKDIVWQMDLGRVARIDRSFKSFVDGIDSQFRRWQL